MLLAPILSAAGSILDDENEQTHSKSINVPAN